MGKFKHGMNETPTHISWQSMRTRCYNPSRDNYAYYGGRGITVCERWATFENFYADMGVRPLGTSLERRDNDKPYEPGNCYWATKLEQSNNRRSTRWFSNGVVVLTLKEVADLYDLKIGTAQQRYDRTGTFGHGAWEQV